MLDKSSVLFWNEVEHDLYEEKGKIFGIELDLFNGHQTYYYKEVQDEDLVDLAYLGDNIYKAIEKFNSML